MFNLSLLFTSFAGHKISSFIPPAPTPGCNYETNILKMRENGLDVPPPLKVNRTRSDGIKLTWFPALSQIPDLYWLKSRLEP